LKTRVRIAKRGMMMFDVPVGRWLLVPSLAACMSGPVSAQSPDPLASFYSGKQINLVIGFSPGGGYDAYARVLARHMGKHIPGNPKIIVKNMPGAGGTVAANYVFNVSPKDGSELGLFAGNVAIDPLLGGAPVKYDARKFGWLGSPYSDTSLCVAWHTTPFRTIADTLQNEMVTGAFGNAGTDFPTALNNVVGTRMKLIKGYPGSNAVKLALERGEVQGGCGFGYDSLRATSPDWLKEKKVHLLVQIALRKDPRLPDVPFVMDLAKSEEDRSPPHRTCRRRGSRPCAGRSTTRCRIRSSGPTRKRLRWISIHSPARRSNAFSKSSTARRSPSSSAPRRCSSGSRKNHPRQSTVAPASLTILAHLAVSLTV
jgi:tripartite-type tricarboxylate transporter receptor subunit TctC